MKKPYPRDGDVQKAIIEAISINPLVKPIEFCDEVKRVLEDKGFYTGLLTIKRIWRIYEKMVKKGVIYDYLDVVRSEK